MRILPTALAATVLFGLPLAGQTQDPTSPPEQATFRSIVATLSGDDFGGRGVGTAGGARARDWIEARFRRSGWNRSRKTARFASRFGSMTGRKPAMLPGRVAAGDRWRING